MRSSFSTLALNFYPRPPRGGRHDRARQYRWSGGISIHALREEGDLSAANTPAATSAFLSTPSARRATCERHQSPADRFISIHALREEGDQPADLLEFVPDEFLSTPSARRATCDDHCNAFQLCNFYPRPPRGGRLHRLPLRGHDLAYFYPRPPRGGRLVASWAGVGSLIFLSTPSARRATQHHAAAFVAHTGFLSTPSARRATGFKMEDATNE